MIVGSLLSPQSISGSSGGIGNAELCSVGDLPTSPLYYRVKLVPTGRIPGTRLAQGYSDVSFRRSPFGISLTKSGSYNYELDISFTGVGYRGPGHFVAWVATPELDEVRLIGILDRDYRTSGTVEWNKFLVIITLEATDEPGGRWQGPVVARGISRSGLMHTMAGHGPFAQEPCASYGF